MFKRREVRRFGKQAQRDVQAETTAAAGELLGKLDEAAKGGGATKESQHYQEVFDSEFWVALCFQSRSQKEAFLKAIGQPSEDGDKYVDGLALAKRMKVELPPAVKLISSKARFVDQTAEKDE